MMKIRITRVHPEAVLPAYAYARGDDAGLDLRAVEAITLPPGGSGAVPTGLAVEIPQGYEGQVRPRSGICLKHSVVANFGTIDPGYRGEIRVVMFNFGHVEYIIEPGDRIAQLVLARYEAVEWEEGDLGASKRGTRGFGSSSGFGSSGE
jgi:dUTP pyrophosphatase